MNITIDIDALRKDLARDYYAGAFSAMPAMLVEAWDIESASDDEIVRMALKNGIDLTDYEV